MASVAVRLEAPSGRLLRRLDSQALSAWLLTATIGLYLAIYGGGYDLVVHSQVGIVVWWIVLISALWGLLPVGGLSRPAWGGLALFGAFVAWTAIATTWSLSLERSLDQLSLVACYLGIFVLGLAIHRDREGAVRHTLNALAFTIVVVACLALASRLRPDVFPAANQTASFITGTQQRLSWPLNYWNALGALLAFGLPLLLAVASSARSLYAQAAAAAGIPLLLLTGYLTFSRAGAVAAVIAIVVFLALTSERIPKIATAAVTGAGGAALIAAAAHRTAIEHGLTTPAVRRESGSLIVAIILVCAGVALVQFGIGLAARHGTPPRWLSVSASRARVVLAAGVAACVIAALLVGIPRHLAHAWRDFKHPTAPSLRDYSLGRYGTLSGNGRYDYWRVAVDATNSHLLGGSGPGTYQLLWQPRAPYWSPVENSHSLFFDTLAELGVVGVGLLVSFFALVITAAVRLVLHSRDEVRAVAAGVCAAIAAFTVSALFDWIWLVPALPAVFLLLAAALLAPTTRRGQSAPSTAAVSRRWGRFETRSLVAVGAVVLAVACIVAIAIPLATTTAVRRSQGAAASGNVGTALMQARQAARLEPGAATPQAQLALVLELQNRPGDALTPAVYALRDEPDNWTTWLLVARLEAEMGYPRASLQAYFRARSLNPRSPVFVFSK